jgi:hypothetical protein
MNHFDMVSPFTGIPRSAQPSRSGLSVLLEHAGEFRRHHGLPDLRDEP